MNKNSHILLIKTYLLKCLRIIISEVALSKIGGIYILILKILIDLFKIIIILINIRLCLIFLCLDESSALRFIESFKKFLNIISQVI